MMINLYILYRIYIICDVDSILWVVGASSTQLEVLGRKEKSLKKEMDKEIRPQESVVPYISKVKA